MADSVRAAVLVGPGRYEVQEFPYPRLAEGAALLQVEMVGICGTDKHTYAGETKQYAGCVLGLSSGAKGALGVRETKAFCEMSYAGY